MRTVAAFSLLLNFLIASPAFAEVAAIPATPSAVAVVSGLEKKLFSHSYANGLSERVCRLERYVFGETRTNCSLTQRISRLVSTVVQPNVPPARSISANPVDKALRAKDLTSKPVLPAANLNRKPPVLQSNYPRVSNLERRLLGDTFANEPVTDRLARLERKLFGRPSCVPDLAIRVDSIEYAASTARNSETTFSTVAAQTTYYSPGSMNLLNTSPSNAYIDPYGYAAGLRQLHTRQQRRYVSTVDQIEFLEMAAFGRIRANKRLEERVDAIEKCFHRTKMPNDSLTDRVARIWAVN